MFQKKRLIELSSSKGHKSVCGFVREKEERALCRWGSGGEVEAEGEGMKENLE